MTTLDTTSILLFQARTVTKMAITGNNLNSKYNMGYIHCVQTSYCTKRNRRVAEGITQYIHLLYKEFFYDSCLYEKSYLKLLIQHRGNRVNAEPILYFLSKMHRACGFSLDHEYLFKRIAKPADECKKLWVIGMSRKPPDFAQFGMHLNIFP